MFRRVLARALPAVDVDGPAPPQQRGAPDDRRAARLRHVVRQVGDARLEHRSVGRPASRAGQLPDREVGDDRGDRDKGAGPVSGIEVQDVGADLQSVAAPVPLVRPAAGVRRRHHRERVTRLVRLGAGAAAGSGDQPVLAAGHGLHDDQVVHEAALLGQADVRAGRTERAVGEEPGDLRRAEPDRRDAVAAGPVRAGRPVGVAHPLVVERRRVRGRRACRGGSGPGPLRVARTRRPPGA